MVSFRLAGTPSIYRHVGRGGVVQTWLFPSCIMKETKCLNDAHQPSCIHIKRVNWDFEGQADLGHGCEVVDFVRLHGENDAMKGCCIS